MFIVAPVGQNPITSLVNYFQNKKALSESTAVPMTTIDWTVAGILIDPTKSSFHPYNKFIKKTLDNRYWLKESGVEEYIISQGAQWKIVITVTVFLLVLGFTYFV